MNKWKLTQIINLINPKQIINVSNEETFDYLKIVDLNKVKYENQAKNVLFFFTYSTDKDLTDEFIINPFDLRTKSSNIIKNNPNYTYVIDEQTYNNLGEEKLNTKFIIVENILDSINALYDYIIKKNKAKVIAVTGSVGKTTAVGLIESVIHQKYQVLRIYSKRITPIILKANIINFVTPTIEYIVLEMSIYHRDHVEILSDILKPDIAALIGVDSSHLEYFNSIDDICKYKSSIFRYAEYGYYNNLDGRVKQLSVKDNQLYWQQENIYNTKLKALEPIVDNYVLSNSEIIINNLHLKLFFNTQLSVVQTLLAYKIGKLLSIKDEDIEFAINNYTPVENRICQKVAFGKQIIFDGDITTNERIKQLANHKYDESYLVIRKFGSAENNKRFNYVLDSLDKFTKVFIFDDIEYLNMLSKHPKTEIVNSHNFMKDLTGQIIYHYSGYYRSFDEYNENNLIKLENERYKILKPKEE